MNHSVTRPPAVVRTAAAVATGLVLLPVVGLAWRAPWSALGRHLTDPAVTSALGLSVVVSVAAAVLATGLGVPLAVMLARGRFRGRAALRAFVLLPLVLPPVVGGTALLFALGRRGLIGGWLESALGVTLPFTTAGAIVAATFVALPFVVLAVESGVAASDPALEEVAATLGAGPWARFRRVTLPALGPSLIAAATLAWARALGEFGATVTFAGSVEGETRTLPLAVVSELHAGRTDTAVALSLVLLAVSVGVLLALRDRWWPAP